MSNISLHLGDCLEVMHTIPDGSVDMVLADLPYGTTACKWDVVIPFEPLWKHYKRVIKRNGAIVLFGSQPFTSMLVMSNPHWFRYEWVYQKNAGSNFATARQQPIKEHENVLVFYALQPTYNPQLEVRTPENLARARRRDLHTRTSEHLSSLTAPVRGRTELRLPGSVKKFNRERGLHPTQKPVALMEYLIRTYTNEGETVLDNTCGSGTTLVACINTNRNGIGIEKDAGYFEIATKRIQDAERRIEAAQVAPQQLEMVV